MTVEKRRHMLTILNLCCKAKGVTLVPGPFQDAALDAMEEIFKAGVEATMAFRSQK